MNYQQREVFTTQRHEFSRQSVAASMLFSRRVKRTAVKRR